MEVVEGVRVRGIYSTALARLLLDGGVPIVDASFQLKERFGDEVSDKGVAVVTVKDRGDRRGLVIIGERNLASKVLNLLKKELRRSPFVVMPAELRATYVCKRLTENLVELPSGVKGVLEGGARESEFVIAHTVSYRNGYPVLREGIAVLGRFARLIEGRRHSVSEYIRGSKRALLFSLAERLGLEGWGVEWRSSAKWVDLTVLMEELQRLKEIALKVKKECQKVEGVGKLTDGELLAFVPLSADDKLRLDRVRSKQVATAPCHHLVKACGERYSALVDVVESFIECCDKSCISKLLVEVITSELKGTRLRLLHEKPEGHLVEIRGEAAVKSRKPLIVKLTRRISGGGVYDGLGIPKEEGDYAISFVVPFSYILPHAYFNREGKLKGVYVNINTPIEPAPPGSVWYIDAYVDVVWKEDEGVQVVDAEELERAVERGIFGEEAAREYMHVARKVAEKLSSEPLIDELADLAVELSIREFA